MFVSQQALLFLMLFALLDLDSHHRHHSGTSTLSFEIWRCPHLCTEMRLQSCRTEPLSPSSKGSKVGSIGFDFLPLYFSLDTPNPKPHRIPLPILLKSALGTLGFRKGLQNGIWNGTCICFFFLFSLLLCFFFWGGGPPSIFHRILMSSPASIIY